jgi:hypothetical protein
MKRIKIDDDMREELEKGRPVELCDHQGNIVGMAWPDEYDPANIDEPPIDLEQVKRELAEGPHISTAELLDKLRRIP